VRLSTPAELREDSRIARQIARKEADAGLKILWAEHALALAQLAEMIERRQKLPATQPSSTFPATQPSPTFPSAQF
jgi:hypothetical protein